MDNIPQAQKKYVLTDIMKKRKHQSSLNEERARQIKERIQKKKQKTKDFVHPEKFVDQYRKQQTAFSYFKRKERKQNLETFDIKSIPINKTLLVVRIRGVKDISDRQQKLLKELRLSKVNTAVFLKTTVEIWKKLKLVENYITYGLPTRQIINDLIVKRGHIMKEKEIIALKSNEIIEEYMSEKDIICVEDIVNTIANASENFDFVTKFLVPLKLNHPEGQLKSGRIKKPLTKQGEWGYREEKINSLVQNMI
ncbi:unnamed protein product [Paramecium sonneborni]|uniref:Large ribosomal subunit protein uL30-like ferredoxin-like fold domain-containing protein n=1 Tax=Paramecium sonneborni TaxID=65129 RepID=A0A8S1PSS0_9CILI|nr:unnamed protein product [Paramecium sonneborni]